MNNIKLKLLTYLLIGSLLLLQQGCTGSTNNLSVLPLNIKKPEPLVLENVEFHKVDINICLTIDNYKKLSTNTDKIRMNYKECMLKLQSYQDYYENKNK